MTGAPSPHIPSSAERGQPGLLDGTPGSCYCVPAYTHVHIYTHEHMECITLHTGLTVFVLLFISVRGEFLGSFR